MVGLGSEPVAAMSVRVGSSRPSLLWIVLVATVAACNGLPPPVPRENPEALFTRCMADAGYQVTDVEIDLNQDDLGLVFAFEGNTDPRRDGAVQRCREAVRSRFPD